MDTITILTNRGDFSNALYEALDAKWSKYGIHVEQVNVQDVRYPEAIRESYAKAQQAEIDKATALNQQEVAKTEADTKVEIAKREAQANAELAASLTDEILRQAVHRCAEGCCEPRQPHRRARGFHTSRERKQVTFCIIRRGLGEEIPRNRKSRSKWAALLVCSEMFSDSNMRSIGYPRFSSST